MIGSSQRVYSKKKNKQQQGLHVFFVVCVFFGSNFAVLGLFTSLLFQKNLRKVLLLNDVSESYIFQP